MSSVLRPLTLFAALASCGGESSSPPPVGPNVLLITVDTLRADVLGCYGSERALSPALDAFAADAQVFEHCQASSAWTLSSLASLMTGLPSATHRAYSMTDRLGPALSTMAEELCAAGWDTAAVASHVFLGTDYGLHQGFVHYDEDLVHSVAASHAAISSPSVSDKGLAFLEEKAAADDDRPWFLWLHYFDPHDTYLEHEGLSERFGTESERELYEGEVAFTDLHLGRVFDGLEQLGLSEDTIVVFTADHGEEFGDHDGHGHGHTLYAELLRVPLIVRVPGAAPGRTSELVSLVDLAPSVREWCALPPRSSSGQSWAPLFEGGALQPRAALAELRLDADRPLDAWIEDGWKLVIDASSGEYELYELASDPSEQRDRADEEPARAARMLDALIRNRGAALAAGEPYERGARRSVLPGEGARLGDLGYGEGALDTEGSEQ